MNEHNHSNLDLNQHLNNTSAKTSQSSTPGSEAVPEPAGQTATLPFASAVMASIIFLLLVFIVCITIHHAAAPPALAASKDADMEVRGTTQVIDNDESQDVARYIFKGHVTNTGNSIAPSVALKAIFHYTFHDIYGQGHEEPLTGTVLLTTFKNLRPGESRDFECPTDVPSRPDPTPGTVADRWKYACIPRGMTANQESGLPCFGPYRHMTYDEAEAKGVDTQVSEDKYDRAPKPDSVETEATVENSQQ